VVALHSKVVAPTANQTLRAGDLGDVCFIIQMEPIEKRTQHYLVNERGDKQKAASVMAAGQAARQFLI
jgi:hypothetical protein